MIIVCPACASRYAVPDDAIGAQGRTVRCAKCHNSWFQEGALAASVAQGGGAVVPPQHVPATVTQTPATPPPAEWPGQAEPDPRWQDSTGQDRTGQDSTGQEWPAPAPQGEPASAAIPPAPASGEGGADQATASSFLDFVENGGFDDAPPAFAHEPPFRPRRNPARMWTLLAISFAVLTLSATAAVWRFGLPAWLPIGHSPFAAGQPDLVRAFPPTRQDRRTLANGSEYFGVSGTITNVGKERRSVPQLLVVLRDEQGRKVYSWEITPAKRVLAPGEVLTVSEAMTDIPKNAKSADIGWKAE